MKMVAVLVLIMGILTVGAVVAEGAAKVTKINSTAQIQSLTESGLSAENYLIQPAK